MLHMHAIFAGFWPTEISNAMTRLVFLCALVQLLVSTVTANAPYDFSNECVNPTNFRIVPPEVEDNVCVLMDSRYYTSLIGSSGVWRAIETDSNGGTVR